MYYIQENCRHLNIQSKEHQRAVVKKKFKTSAIAEHPWNEPGHDIIFEVAKRIANEIIYFPRIIRKAVEIVKRLNSINWKDGHPLNAA
jgi:hypothetical protein